MVKRRPPAVSPAETEILRIVWQLGKATVQNVRAKLPAKKEKYSQRDATTSFKMEMLSSSYITRG